VSELVRRTTSTVSVLIVDDQHPFRAVARTVVEMAEGFTLVGEAESGEDAVVAVDRWHPDLVLMDVNLPGISGIEATRRVLASSGSTRVVLLSTYPAADLPADARTCGASAYVHKGDLTADVLGTLWTSTR
jgi:DNA-binding NarL/FixJ family response regulator